MTQLIIYINSEQKASAYYDNCYVSFHGARYSNLEEFAQIIKEELRVKSLSEIKDGISVLVVSNGATNETVRTVIYNLLHTDEEKGCLNVNVQELNVIESKYFLPMLGNPETPEAEDFARFFEFKNFYSDKFQQLEELTSEVSTLKKTIEEKDSEINELQSFKESVTKKAEEKLTKINEVREKREIEAQLIKADFIHDSQWDINNRYFPRSDTDIVYFHKKLNDGDYVKSDGSTIIGKYNDVKGDSKWSLNGARLITCNNMSGRIYYFAKENETITHGTPIAIIGDFNSIEEAKSYAKEHYLI